MSEKVVVVIFIHKENPDEYELISFRQCFKILHKHPIKVIAPEGLDLHLYNEVLQNAFEVIFVERKWLSSISQYNRFKLSRYFYSLVSNYEYLLTYELDAFVFSDQLNEWCEKGYDFIGAPWYRGKSEPLIPYEFLGVGNSGFSLRKIKSFKTILKHVFFPSPAGKKLGFEWIKAAIMYLYVSIRTAFFENYSIQKYFEGAEDLVLHGYSVDFPNRLKIPTPQIALSFSFETIPSHSYILNQSRLPFGCHAWWRYDLGFWKPFIESFGYKL
ncbi:MAG: DUF5672 family protein [Puia sp.]